MYELTAEQEQIISENIKKLEVLKTVYELMISTKCNVVTDETVENAVDMDRPELMSTLNALDEAGLLTFADWKVTSIKEL